MTIPSVEFKTFVSSLRSAIFADQCGASMLPDQRDALMAAAEATLLTWLAHRQPEIEALRWVLQGDHA